MIHKKHVRYTAKALCHYNSGKASFLFDLTSSTNCSAKSSNIIALTYVAKRCNDGVVDSVISQNIVEKAALDVLKKRKQISYVSKLFALIEAITGQKRSTSYTQTCPWVVPHLDSGKLAFHNAAFLRSVGALTGKELITVQPILCISKSNTQKFRNKTTNP